MAPTLHLKKPLSFEQQAKIYQMMGSKGIPIKKEEKLGGKFKEPSKKKQMHIPGESCR